MFLTESTFLSRNTTGSNVNIPGPPRFMKMNEIPVMLTPGQEIGRNYQILNFRIIPVPFK